MTAFNNQWLVVTDLDGTLLNHDDYSVDSVSQGIDKLHEKNIPVILNTSKTYAETIEIQKILDIDDPFIVENGSCLYLPKSVFAFSPQAGISRDDYWSVELGRSHTYISSVLLDMETEDGLYTRLSQCSIEQAVSLTGLSDSQAENAIRREFSEPIIWNGDDDALRDFQQILEKHHLSTLQGGRFLHVIGQCDKGMALSSLSKCYSEDVKIIALGDSANDAAMLLQADISIIVKSPSNYQLLNLVTPTIQTTECAPAGWSEGINKALMMMQNNQEI